MHTCMCTCTLNTQHNTNIPTLFLSLSAFCCIWVENWSNKITAGRYVWPIADFFSSPRYRLILSGKKWKLLVNANPVHQIFQEMSARRNGDSKFLQLITTGMKYDQLEACRCQWCHFFVSFQIITYDPSKMTHSLKRLKCDDVSSAENSGNLTWQLEENESEITKRRQGQFPSWQAPRKESIFSRLHGLAMEENISDTEMEVVPVGKMTSHSKMPFASGCGYESSDSAGSADTDEILSKASRKTSSQRTPSSITKSPHEKVSERTPSSVTRSSHEKLSEKTPSSITKSSHKKLSEQTPSSITKSPHEKLSESERTPSRAKNCQLKASPVKTSNGKDYESDSSNSGDDADSEETPTLTKVPSKKKATNLTSFSGPSIQKKAPVDSSDSDSEAAEAGQGPQFKFVKNKTVQGRCLKKSVKMSQPKTPPFRGLGTLLSDEDNKGEEERRKVSTPSTEKKAPKTNSLTEKQAPKSPEIRGLNMPSHGRGDGLLRISSPERRSDKLLNASSKLNQKSSQDLKSVGSPNSSTSQLFQRKRVSEDCEDTDDVLTARRTPKRKEQELSKMTIEEFAGGIEEGSPLASSSRKSSRLEGSDDSDLDDNDFELVGKKLEARAKQQQDRRTKTDKSQRGTSLDSTSSAAPGIRGTKKTKGSVVRSILLFACFCTWKFKTKMFS